MCSPNGGDHSSDEQRSSPSESLANWRQPGPLGWKIQRTLVNTWIKVARRQPCCGHSGEPGC
jgi:hypothetical protein